MAKESDEDKFNDIQHGMSIIAEESLQYAVQEFETAESVETLNDLKVALKNAEEYLTKALFEVKELRRQE